jgi:hypothetical protein
MGKVTTITLQFVDGIAVAVRQATALELALGGAAARAENSEIEPAVLEALQHLASQLAADLAAAQRLAEHAVAVQR